MKRKRYKKQKKQNLQNVLNLQKFGNKISVTLLEQKWFSSNYIKFDLFREEKFPEANFLLD